MRLLVLLLIVAAGSSAVTAQPVSDLPSISGIEWASGPDDCASVSSIELGQTVTATLVEATACEYIDGSAADYYALDLEADTRVVITHRSDDFDAFLALIQENGVLVASDDDSAGGPTGFDATVSVHLSAGRYLIAANHIEGDGEYQLTVRAE
ncbi:hypothetical protein [Rubrivirga sp.]|uniref:hypothetical protein n=1 Tax=Rubrivirga sp. TaxID=1885344 RepID=UPI003C733BE1